MSCQPPRGSSIDRLKGDYLGQTPPGSDPEVFAPGIVSRGFHELGLAIAPDQSEIFYITSDRQYSHYVIITVKREDEVWGEPEVAPFSGDHSDYALAFSPDGRRLYFSSKRPVPGTDGPSEFHNIWRVEKADRAWSEPIFCQDLSFEGASQVNPSFAKDGTVYYQISRPGTGGDLYYARISDGAYSGPIKLEAPISTEHNEGRPFISPDEDRLLFHSDRPGGSGSMDIYISFKQEDGSWGEPMNLGEPVNSEVSDFGPYLSPDGKYLFFSSYRGLSAEQLERKSYRELMGLYGSPKNGYATLYWVDARVLERIKR